MIIDKKIKINEIEKEFKNIAKGIQIPTNVNPELDTTMIFYTKATEQINEILFNFGDYMQLFSNEKVVFQKYEETFPEIFERSEKMKIQNEYKKNHIFIKSTDKIPHAFQSQVILKKNNITIQNDNNQRTIISDDTPYEYNFFKNEILQRKKKQKQTPFLKYIINEAVKAYQKHGTTAIPFLQHTFNIIKQNNYYSPQTFTSLFKTILNSYKHIIKRRILKKPIKTEDINQLFPEIQNTFKGFEKQQTFKGYFKIFHKVNKIAENQKKVKEIISSAKKQPEPPQEPLKEIENNNLNNMVSILEETGAPPQILYKAEEIDDAIKNIDPVIQYVLSVIEEIKAKEIEHEMEFTLEDLDIDVEETDNLAIGIKNNDPNIRNYSGFSKKDINNLLFTKDLLNYYLYNKNIVTRVLGTRGRDLTQPLQGGNYTYALKDLRKKSYIIFNIPHELKDVITTDINHFKESSDKIVEKFLPKVPKNSGRLREDFHKMGKKILDSETFTENGQQFMQYTINIGFEEPLHYYPYVNAMSTNKVRHPNKDPEAIGFFYDTFLGMYLEFAKDYFPIIFQRIMGKDLMKQRKKDLTHQWATDKLPINAYYDPTTNVIKKLPSFQDMKRTAMIQQQQAIQGNANKRKIRKVFDAIRKIPFQRNLYTIAEKAKKIEKPIPLKSILRSISATQKEFNEYKEEFYKQIQRFETPNYRYSTIFGNQGLDIDETDPQSPAQTKKMMKRAAEILRSVNLRHHRSQEQIFLMLEDLANQPDFRETLESFQTGEEEMLGEAVEFFANFSKYYAEKMAYNDALFNWIIEGDYTTDPFAQVPIQHSRFFEKATVFLTTTLRYLQYPPRKGPLRKG